MLNKKILIIISGIITLVMFCVVMFIVNPLIDAKDGVGVLALQLSFNKEVGVEIINSWGQSGIENFKQLIFTDYIYALGYSIFFASILSTLILKKGKENLLTFRMIIYLPFLAGLFDWIENSIELLFINNPIEFSNTLFFIHSIIASLKWAVLPIVMGYIIVLLLQKNVNTKSTIK